ncbi:MAG: response regulator [Planctomycetota bacterium]|nr:response regulator [Planctomycetota bacterium]
MSDKKKILAVDDEVQMTKMLKRNLDVTGKFEVRTENEGLKALAAAKEFRPDLILLDVMMPDADGGEVAAQILADPDLKGTPIIFLTAIVEKQEVEGSAGTIGGHPFLAKPIRTEDLITAIEENLRE